MLAKQNFILDFFSEFQLDSFCLRYIFVMYVDIQNKIQVNLSTQCLCVCVCVFDFTNDYHHVSYDDIQIVKA